MSQDMTASVLLAMSTVPIVPDSVDGPLDGPLESWPSFRDVSRQQAEALLGDQDMVFVVRKKSDDPKNPDVFVLTFMTDKTDKKNTMKSIIMFRDPVTRAQYRGERPAGIPADSPMPWPWYPSVLQFLAASYQPYGADLRPFSSTSQAGTPAAAASAPAQKVRKPMTSMSELAAKNKHYQDEMESVMEMNKAERERGPLESWPSFQDVSREEAEALVKDKEKVFVVRKKSDERENPHVFVLTFKNPNETDKMEHVIIERKHKGDAGSPKPWYPEDKPNLFWYHHIKPTEDINPTGYIKPTEDIKPTGYIKPTEENPKPLWYPYVWLFLARSYPSYGADLRPFSSADAQIPAAAASAKPAFKKSKTPKKSKKVKKSKTPKKYKKSKKSKKVKKSKTPKKSKKSKTPKKSKSY